MASLKTKLKHIDYRDKGDFLAEYIGNRFSELSSRVGQISFNYLLQNSDSDKKLWSKTQMITNLRFRNEVKSLITKEGRNLLKRVKNDAKEIKYDSKQRKQLALQISDGLNMLSSVAITQHETIIQEIRSSATPILYDAIVENIKRNNPIQHIIYQGHTDSNGDWVEGKHFKFESYMEMKVRTDIHHELATNIVRDSSALGVVFYTTSFFGNSAEDHAPYQSKIYYDEDYESIVSEDKLQQVEDYITSHKLLSVQQVKDGKPYLCTRPNCRHWFEPLTISEVLGIDANNSKDVGALQRKLNATFDGTYNADKYDALQQQRTYERNMRQIKDTKEMYQGLIDKASRDTPMKDIQEWNRQIDSCNHKLYGFTEEKNGKKYHHDGLFEKQRDLLAQHPELQRQYDREQSHALVTDMGTNYRKNIKR